jgi:outer membrane protein OmpA-like peptidoglycan-associated protein
MALDISPELIYGRFGSLGCCTVRALTTEGGVMKELVLSIVITMLAGCGAGKSEGAKTGGAAASESNAGDGPLSETGQAEGQTADQDDALQSTETQGVQDDESTVVPPEAPPPGPLAATETESLLQITVVNDKGEAIPGVIITVENAAHRKFVSRESDENGFLELLVPRGDTYTTRFVSLDEEDITKEIPMPDQPNITANFKLIYTPPKTKSFVLKGVFFDTAKWNLRPESYPNLEHLLEYMTLKKRAHIQLEGHTDSVGDDRANQVLSQRRAESVKQYLVKKGVQSARIKAVGFGESKPIASNDTEEGRQTNRRTVVTIISE